MSAPSDKAVEAARKHHICVAQDPVTIVDTLSLYDATRVLTAAHDSALGLDRSVCLRDVVEALRGTPELYDPYAHEGYSGDDAADFIEREFGS